MAKSPKEFLISFYEKVKKESLLQCLSNLPENYVANLRTIIDNAETLKAVLGVTLTSIVYKILNPDQDIRYHQENMKNGYSGRTFDTKYTTPFLKERFRHFAMAESAWLTRSLEQPHPYDFSYPGKIRNLEVKQAFLNILNFLQTNPKDASKMLEALLALMIEKTNQEISFSNVSFSKNITNISIEKIIEAVNQHIYYKYEKWTVGTARIPVIAIYSVYDLLMLDVKRYSDKKLISLEHHTSPDSRSKSLGDIEIKSTDDICFEAIEIKHLKPISLDIISDVYQKIKNTSIDRYYILTTNEPNFDDKKSVEQKIIEYSKLHPCQIIVNGVLPSLKYYLRLVSNPELFTNKYTYWLEYEYNRASGIKKEHLQVWQEICKKLFNINNN